MRKVLNFLAVVTYVQGSFANLPILDASGRAGSDGVSGQSFSTSSRYSSGFGRGGDGRDGGHAGRSTPGQNAGSITVNIRDKELQSGVPQIAIIEMDASILNSDGQSSRKASQFSAGGSGFIYLQAKGGRGGAGGLGGDAEGGQRGCDGRDATQFSRGTDGCNGGNGGDGGDATPGSNGGQGGQIKVELKSEDTHLAMMVEASVDGGEGGRGSVNGSGGQGGQGGSGGSSYSWTTREYDGQDCREQNNGNGSSTRICTDRYRTVYHSQSGGSSGMSGSRGRDGRGNTSAGSKGQDGRFSFVVHDNDVKRTYTRPFSIRIREYTLKDSNNDGITEPGELMTIENIRVENAGPMPWNATKAEFLVFLENTGWVMVEPLALKVPSLAPGELTTLKDKLVFRIKETSNFGKDKRWSTTDSIVPKNLVTRVNRTQDGFTLVRPMTITFPLEITPLVSKYSVGPGETQKILWRIKNISQQPLGGSSRQLREILQTLRVQSDSEPDVQYRKSGGEFSLLDEKKLLEIALLNPGEEVLIEGEVKFAQTALPYTDRNFQVDLSLGKLNDPTKPQKIQEQTFKFKISQLYNYNAEADWVLIVNNNTQREEFLAWNRLAKELGIKMDVWDMSYYGKLMFSQTMTQHENSFTKNYARKTAIILNNSLQVRADQQPRQALDVVSQNDFVESLIKGGLNVVVIGPEKKPFDVLEKLVVDQQNSMHISQNTNELLKRVQSESEKIQFGLIGQAPVSTYKLFGQPSEADLRKNATKMADALLKQNPSERFIVSYDIDFEKSGWFKYNSTLKVQKVVNPIYGKLAVLDVDDRIMQTADFIYSPENIFSVLEAMNYGAKLRIFARMPNPNSPLSTLVSDAVIRDLIEEQDFAFQVLVGTWQMIKRTTLGLFKGETLLAGLDRKYRCLMGLGVCANNIKLRADTLLGSNVLKIAAAMKFYHRQVQSWDKVLGGKATMESVVLHRRDMQKLADAVVANHFPDQMQLAQDLIRTHEAKFNESLKARNKAVIGNSSDQNARIMLTKPSLGATYNSDQLFKPQNQIRGESRQQRTTKPDQGMR